jgi:hypothetical protein
MLNLNFVNQKPISFSISHTLVCGQSMYFLEID